MITRTGVTAVRLLKCSTSVHPGCLLRPSVVAEPSTAHRTLYYKPEEYLTPILDPNTRESILQSEEQRDKLTFSQILPNPSYKNIGLFTHPTLLTFTNYLMIEGNKSLANELMLECFAHIKRVQLKVYHAATTDVEREKIVCDPLAVFLSAIENVRPHFSLMPIKKGGITYQVPVPIPESRSYFTGMKWLVEAGRDRPRSMRMVHFPEHMGNELVDSHYCRGRVVQKKLDLHRQCENNRAYAHYRYSSK